MKNNVKHFLIQSSIPEGLFLYTKYGYAYNKGHLKGRLISDVIVDYREETLEFLEELYDETESFHTKYVIEDIISIIKKSKI
jgi:hypothetical protein